MLVRRPRLSGWVESHQDGARDAAGESTVSTAPPSSANSSAKPQSKAWRLAIFSHSGTIRLARAGPTTYVTFQMADVVVSRDLSGCIPELIGNLRTVPVAQF
ncbi:MAG: hypothetical protein O7H40_00705 [Gammaproteobacteria bacterium]|nr:hypothetical protein [Gammaproteobacteria bacterium]